MKRETCRVNVSCFLCTKSSVLKVHARPASSQPFVTAAWSVWSVDEMRNNRRSDEVVRHNMTQQTQQQGLRVVINQSKVRVSAQLCFEAFDFIASF